MREVPIIGAGMLKPSDSTKVLNSVNQLDSLFKFILNPSDNSPPLVNETFRLINRSNNDLNPEFIFDTDRKSDINNTEHEFNTICCTNYYYCYAFQKTLLRFNIVGATITESRVVFTICKESYWSAACVGILNEKVK